MGLYDREYYQDEDQGGSFSPLSGSGVGSAQRSIVITLIVINVAIFLIDWIFANRSDPGQVHRLTNYLALPSNLLTEPWRFYTLLTYGFAHAPFDSPHGIWHILFNMYALWLFGRDVERRYGRWEFLRLYLATIVFSGFVWFLVQQFSPGAAHLVGASGGVVGVVVLFALNFPHRQFVLIFLPTRPIPAWVLGAFIVGMDFLSFLFLRGSNVAYVAHLAGAAFAFGYFKSGVNFGRFTPNKIAMPKLKRRPKLEVFDGGEPHVPLDAEADRVLDKLHREGEESLTPKERKTLEDYSRRMRQKYR